MNLSEHEKALLAIESLAQQIGERGEQQKDQVLINIASDLQLFMVTAMSGDLPDFLNYVNEYREKKIKETLESIRDLQKELETGKKVTPTEKIARMNLTTEN